MVDRLNQLDGIKCALPEGAFYAYPNVGEYLGRNGTPDVLTLTQRLLEEAHVALVPGNAFGTNTHVRISYATSQQQINEGLHRLRNFFKSQELS